MSKLLVLIACVVACVAATEWAEPQYVEDAAEPALIEEGGVPVTVSGRKGMVTYISPARHVQTSGIVFTPPPRVQVQAVATPIIAQPQVIAAPLYVQPVYRPYSDVHVHHSHHSHHSHGHAHPFSHSHSRGHHLHSHSHGHHHHHGMIHGLGHAHHSHHHHHAGVESVLNAPFHHPAGFHFGHRHSRRHRNHAHARGDLAVHIANARIGGGGAVHQYSPEAIPVSYQNMPRHPAHYGHKSDSVSYGPIVVPHTPRGQIAVESAEFAGYNPGPKFQYNTVPTAHFSDGTPYPASINQRFQ